MNKLHIIAGMLVGTALVCASCDSDRDDNPTLKTPTTFTLDTPSFAASTLDLESASTLDFTWTQPDYGFSALAQYQLYLSTSNKWTVSYDEAQADESLTANYTTVGDVVSVCEDEISAEDFAKAIMQLEQYDENAVPETQEVYVRVSSAFNGDTIYSEPLKFTVKPYYVVLTKAMPDLWYLTGSCIGNGSWSTGVDAVGTGLMPLYPETQYDYDAKTGAGTLTWTGYLTTAGFKIGHVPGDFWKQQVGSKGYKVGEKTYGNMEIVWNDGGSQNIVVPADGYYKITFNATTQQCDIEAVDEASASYSTMYLKGTFNSWGTGNPMSAVFTFSGAKNHDWVCDVTISEDGEFKFNGGDSWWGGADFPYGIANGGNNIPCTAGTYKVFFNDITKQYYFIAQE